MLTRFFAAVALNIALGAALAASPALSAPRGQSAAAPLSAEDRAAVTQAEQALNAVHTLQSKFVQLNPDGRQAGGTFYLSRPGKMRLEYDAPVKDFIVADGLFLFYWDSEMKQQSSTPIGSTLADFILRPDIKLSGDVTVTDVFRAQGVLEITLVETKDPRKGSLTLVFEDRPLQLRKWRVLDAQGLTTEVALLNPRVGVPLSSDLFYFKAPASRQEHGG
ncbi:outer membrane lipoprotein carrier protein LolA [Azospirillum sp.]|uniref:LolA family protein n=1 Tax=Azospirillum sp. TaxID=34012 RepID=UPI002D3B1551|nr:outer membrane lipoprotein carrier protein LolA [Azospirillum sp.]HYD69044.1 outer membrane lipoprotein carrier protein LolA [Azospirillum sp.]